MSERYKLIIAGTRSFNDYSKQIHILMPAKSQNLKFIRGGKAMFKL